MRPLLDFERFKYIINSIKEFDEKRTKVSDFFEENLCTSSFCFFDYGSEMQRAVIDMLADEFDCWYDTGSPSLSNEKDQPQEWWETKYSRYSNDIEYWLYDAAPEDKYIEVDGTRISINGIDEFYEYLVKNYNEKNSDIDHDSKKI